MRANAAEGTSGALLACCSRSKLGGRQDMSGQRRDPRPLVTGVQRAVTVCRAGDGGQVPVEVRCQLGELRGWHWSCQNECACPQPIGGQLEPGGQVLIEACWLFFRQIRVAKKYQAQFPGP